MSGAQQPAEEHFSRQQVRRILGVSERQLRAWERQGFVRPERSQSAASNAPQTSHPSRTPAGGAQNSVYKFSDIVTLKTIQELRRNRVPLSRIRMALGSLKTKLGEVRNPLSETRIQRKGSRLSVRFQGAEMDAITGQLLLEYAPAERKEKVRSLGKPAGGTPSDAARRRVQAERFFLAGLRYEEDPRAVTKAIRAYQRAIELNPQAAGAWINLGTVYYNLGKLAEAERSYRAALAMDPDYALIHFNLGNVFDERGDLEKAREHYEEAVRQEPGYADPHYNLALLYEKLGLHGKARAQWQAYLKLDPGSHWSAYARQQLEKTPFRLLKPGANEQKR